MNKLLAILLSTLLLAGCAALDTVQVDISTYGDWPAARTGATYAFDRLPSQQTDPEAAARIEQAARPALEKAGFRPAPPGQTAELLVQLAARHTRSGSDWIVDPLWWHGGFGLHRHPWVGPVWVVDVRRDWPIYEREVALLIRDAASARPLFEARARQQGATRGDDQLLGAMFLAALTDFPRHGPNPRTVRVTLP